VYKKQDHLDSQEDKPYSRVTLNHIFSHNHNWDVYRFKRTDTLRAVEIEEVEKMLSCGDIGYRLYACPGCNELKAIYFGCNSRVCTHCGKKFADKWADNIVKQTFDVKHRHIIFTIPEQLRPYFRHDRRLLKVLMDCSIKVTSYVLLKKLKKKAIPGVIAVIHTYGKDMKFNPHIHCLVTEGGFKKDREWVNFKKFPYSLLRKSWQYHLLTDIKKAIPNTLENSKLIDSLFKQYPKGFYVRAKDTVDNKRGMVRYIGRYIRHPAIAESRIERYDGETVTFYYLDDDRVKHHVEMTVDEFISAVIGHIPDKQFKTIRHYGIYCRGKKRHFRRMLGLVSMAQQKLTKFLEPWAPTCEKCGIKMEYIWSGKKKPPPDHIFGEIIPEWHFITGSLGFQ
jgi:hypothetical protein